MAGMWAPTKRGGGSSYISDWAEVWLERAGGWESRLYELAGYDPIRFREIADSCTLLEIAIAWKTMKAKSDYAWNDRNL